MKPDLFEIPNFCSKEFCHTMIKHSEVLGFVEATANVSGRHYLEYRDNLRLIFDDPALADILWNKPEMNAVKERLNNPGWETLGLNDRFKIYKYLGTKNHYFAPHYDGNYDRIPMQEQSWVTLLIYLNQEFVGGQTVCTLEKGEYAIVPKPGLAAFMTQNNILHEAMPVTEGIKYVLRTDVMYRKIG